MRTNCIDRTLAVVTVMAWAALGTGCPRAGERDGATPDPAQAKELEAARKRVVELERRLGAGEGKPAPWKIINFHDHVYEMKHAETYIGAAKAAGIAKTVLVASPKYTIFGKGGSKTEGFDQNFQEIARIAKRWPDHFIPFSSIDPGSPDKLDMLKRHRALGAKGLKLYNGHSHFYVKEDGLMAEGMDEVLQYLIAEKMPCLWHVRMSSYLEEFEEKVLKKYPELQIVVAHYGVAFWRPKGKLMKELPRLLDTYKNLHFDTSLGTRKILIDGQALMARNRKVFNNLMTRYPDRFVMGTDMVITGNPEKTASWMGKVIWASRDQLEQQEFTFDLAARWSKYKPKRGANADGKMRGLGLPADVLTQIYETTPKKLLGL